MSNSSDEDWASGASRTVRWMIAHEATDDEVDRYLLARRTGNDHVGRTILRTLEQRPAFEHSDAENTAPDDRLSRLRVAALKPVVNRMSATDLQRYVLAVWRLSEQVVVACEDHQWNDGATFEAIAALVVEQALKAALPPP